MCRFLLGEVFHVIEHLKLLDVCILHLLVIKPNIYSKISTNGGSSSYGAWPVMRSQNSGLLIMPRVYQSPLKEVELFDILL